MRVHARTQARRPCSLLFWLGLKGIGRDVWTAHLRDHMRHFGRCTIGAKANANVSATADSPRCIGSPFHIGQRNNFLWNLGPSGFGARVIETIPNQFSIWPYGRPEAPISSPGTFRNSSENEIPPSPKTCQLPSARLTAPALSNSCWNL